MSILLFIFGTTFGSFLQVVAARYDPDKFIFSPSVIGGRSACPYCKKELRWFELVPLISFLIQRGRCRRCRAKISLQYFIVEMLSGLIFVLVPAKISQWFFLGAYSPLAVPLSIIWVAVFLTLLVITLIDIRLHLIPDEANVFLAVLAVLMIFLFTPYANVFFGGSFVGTYALLFGAVKNIWLSHFLALGFGAAFFGVLVVATRGRGMGVGDVKLAAALGFLFGWPDILFITMLAFVTGAMVGIAAIGGRKKTMKSYLPFGPFLAMGATLIFFYGADILTWYFDLFNL